MTLSTISLGGGVQSTAMVVLATQGVIDAHIALFANVGDDSENPATSSYVRDILTPWAAERGVTVHELERKRRDGTVETLFGRLTRDGSRSIPIPVYMPDTGAPGTRSCTVDFKIRVIAKWLKAHGASAANPARVHIGISLDEIHRLNNRRHEAYETLVYPLVDLRLTRQDCMNIIAKAGLPVPEKSSCFFCPFHSVQRWKEMKRDQPALFGQAVELEELILTRRQDIGRDPCYLSRTLRPLSEMSEAQPSLWGESDNPCDSGYCMT